MGAHRAGLVQVDHRGFAHQADGHTQAPLHATAVGVHLLVPHAPIEQVHTAQPSVYRLMQLRALQNKSKVLRGWSQGDL